jgi:hypothetical protein
MAYWITYIMKAYNIPLILVVNNDQTCVCLIPTIGERTWETKGTKHIQVLKGGRKMQVILVVHLIANNFLLPFMFTSIIPRSLLHCLMKERTCA